MQKKSLLYVLQYYIIIIFIYFTWDGVEKYKPIVYLLDGILLIILIYMIIKEKIDIVYRIKCNFLILLIPILCLIITFYSVGFSDSFNCSIKLFMITLNILFLSIVYSKEEFFSLLSKYFIISILFSLIMILVFPSIGKQVYEGQIVVKGVYVHKNILARNMVFAAIFLLNYGKKRRNIISRYIYLINTIIAVSLIIFSKSMTSTLLLVFIICLNVIIEKHIIKIDIFYRLLAFIILAFNMIVCIISNPLLYNTLSLIKIGEKDLTFSGRVYIWNYSIEAIKIKPILGYGFNAFWSNLDKLEKFKLLYGFTVGHSHNGYINLLLDGGLILLALVIYIVFKVLQYNTKFKNKHSLVIILIISFMLLENLFESCLLNESTYIFWIFIIYCYCNCKQYIKNEY